MSEFKPDRQSSGFFETLNKSALALSKKAAGAGVVGLLGKLLISLLTVLFSTRHLTPKAAQLQETLAALEDALTLRRNRAGELKTRPLEKGMRVRLPDNALVRDLAAVQEQGKSYEYAEYVAHSYYVECSELYDHSGAHLDFVAGAMPLFGLMGTVLGLMALFDSLGSVVTVEALAPQLAMALKTTLYGALYASVYKIMASRFEQRLKALDYDFETFCRALQVLIDNRVAVEVHK